jgi:protein-disulfide isomerase
MPASRLQTVGAMAAIAAAVGVWILIATIGVTSYAGWRSMSALAGRDASTVRLRGSVLGRQDATVAVVEFSDFECPSCAAYARRVFPELRKRYVETGMVMYAQKHLVLERLHPNARRAAVAAECASRQSVMWTYRDRLFGSSPTLDHASLLRLADEVVPDPGSFAACLTAADGSAIEADLADAGRLRIGATPTFVVGRVDRAGVITIERTVVGARSVDLFAAIDAVLQRVAQPRGVG